MKPTLREVLAKRMADRVGHGIEEKCYQHAEAALEACEDYGFRAHMLLHEAWRKADTNEETARILRLYCTDFKSFCREYASDSPIYKRLSKTEE